MTPKRASTISKKHHGVVARSFKLPSVQFTQGDETLYLFSARASVLFSSLSINRRVENKDDGYQRVLSVSRVEAISSYLGGGRAIPGAIIVNLDKAPFDAKNGELTIPAGSDVGWVIDGQHRLAGAAMAARGGRDVDLPVVAFVGLDSKAQVEQFVTINREAKNVPTSLYLDLLRHLPGKGRNAAEAIKERATDLATELRRLETSPFFERIAVLGPPKKGQISLVNFVRKISIHIAKNGVLNAFAEPDQRGTISNYYAGLRSVFTHEFDNTDGVFFKTLGFGAFWNAFPTVLSLSLQHHGGFTVSNVATVMKRVSTLDFAAWDQYGQGDQAERTAGEDLRTTILMAFSTTGGKTPGGSIKLV